MQRRRTILLAVAAFSSAACGRRDADAGRRPETGPIALPTALAAKPAAPAPVPDDPPGCLHYEPQKVMLRGTITIQRHYGAPNFGEDTLRDEKLDVPVLRLDSAVAVCRTRGGDIDDETERGVREIQLVTLDPRREGLCRRPGPAVAQGRLFHSHTGWHFTRVLLIVDSVRPNRARHRG